MLTWPGTSLHWEGAVTITVAYQLGTPPPLCSHCSSDPFHHRIQPAAPIFYWVGGREIMVLNFAFKNLLFSTCLTLAKKEPAVRLPQVVGELESAFSACSSS